MASTRYFALVPAAGGGSRMGAELPKQYLSLAGRPLISYALATLAAVSRIDAVFVVLSPDDGYWQSSFASPDNGKVQVLRCGGASRAASVANGLTELRERVADDDWILVHDAARACLSVAHVEALIDTLADDPVGGLLAVPVADTLKREANGRVAATVPREALWQAQTPQMFRYGLLVDALAAAPTVTDEASAVEALGLSPRLVAADATNLKVTYPLDLQLAEWIITNRKSP